MTQQLAVLREEQPLTAAQVMAQVQTIQHVLRDVMRDGVHYGRVPGCGDKPALLKPGAEKIMATFRLSADPHVEDLSTHDEVRYRVKVSMISSSGVCVGVGIGECSSGEEKYKWRRAVVDEEFDETPADRRREKWGRGREGKAYRTKQVRTNPADVANTVLKMAKKRALVDGVLTATAASDCFEQDIEEMEPEQLGDREQPPPRVQRPQAKSGAKPAPAPIAGGLTDSMIKMVTARREAAGLTEAELLSQFSAEKLADIPAANVNDVLDFCKKMGAATDVSQ